MTGLLAAAAEATPRGGSCKVVVSPPRYIGEGEIGVRMKTPTRRNRRDDDEDDEDEEDGADTQWRKRRRWRRRNSTGWVEPQPACVQ